MTNSSEKLQEPIEIAKKNLLETNDIKSSDLERLVGSTKDPNNFSDVYLESSRNEVWTLEDGIVKEGLHSIRAGAGIRFVSGEKTGFAYSDNISKSALSQACKTARTIVKSGQSEDVSLEVKTSSRPPLYLPTVASSPISNEEKLGILHDLDKRIRQSDKRVEEVSLSLSAQQTTILVASSSGEMMADIRPLVRLNATVIVREGDRREVASFGGGGRKNLASLFSGHEPEAIADEALRQALVGLQSVNAPAGEMTVILGSGWPGILLHEAIGHGLEGDFNRKGSSAFSGCMGEKVGSSLCTVVDDGTIREKRGSLNIDDEGTVTENTVLIEKGKLVNYMQDKQNAALMKANATGNGRRESYAHRPMPRMTNTYMLAGKTEPNEIIESVERGLYAVSFGGGQVDITNGKFVFSASEAYLIEKGKISSPVKGATLIGDGPDVLTKVTMVGNDLRLDNGVGTCGKQGQSVPVGVGQPTLKIEKMTVGGTEVNKA
jgi:TldD protein